MNCESNTSKGPCTNEAAHRVYWPGRDPLKFCDEHTASAKEIGAAIGCYIVTEPLPPDAKEKEPKQ